MKNALKRAIPLVVAATWWLFVADSAIAFSGLGNAWGNVGLLRADADGGSFIGWTSNMSDIAASKTGAIYAAYGDASVGSRLSVKSLSGTTRSPPEQVSIEDLKGAGAGYYERFP